MAADMLHTSSTAIANISTSIFSTFTADAATTTTATVTATATPTASSIPFSRPPFPFNTPLFSASYEYLAANLPLTITQLLLLPFYLIYHVEVFVLSTLPRQLANIFGFNRILALLKRIAIWLVNDVLGDIDFIVNIGRRAGWAIEHRPRNATAGDGSARSVADVAAQDPIDSQAEVAELFKSAGMMAYFTSRWGLTCGIVSVIINRVTVFGRARTPIQMDWKRRLIIRLIPIILLSRSFLDLTRTMRCQFSPDYALYRYGDINAPLKHIDYGKEPGIVYYTISTLLSPFETEAQSCSARRMLHVPDDSELSLPKGSYDLLWVMFLRLCTSQVFDAFANAIAGRTQVHEIGVSLFEYSLMFSEAQGMVESTLSIALAKGRENKKHKAKQEASSSSPRDAIMDTITSFAASTVTAITNPTPAPQPLVGAPAPPPIYTIAAPRSSAATHLNVTPELLIIVLLTLAHCLSANILCVIGKENRYRLAHSSFWALSLFAYDLSCFFDISSFVRYPTVAVVSFGPHLSLMLGIVGCLLIYGIALTFTAFSLPGQVPPNITIRERFILARENMQSNSTIFALHVHRSEDFFTALVRIGYEMLTAASKMVFLNEGKPVSARELTWLEEERLAELAAAREQEIARQRTEGSRAIGDDGAGYGFPSHTEYEAILNVNALGQDQPWRSGYAIEKRIEETKSDGRRVRRPQEENVGVGFWRYLDKGVQCVLFWTALSKLIAGWICFWIVKGMNSIGWRWKPNWLLQMAGVTAKGEGKTSDTSGQQATESEESSSSAQDPSPLFHLDRDGKLVLPEDDDYDVEAELRKRAFREERNWSEEMEQQFERRLYEWWRNGGKWGETDASGDYTPPESQKGDWDMTSVISMSSNRSATPTISDNGSDWTLNDDYDNGRRTPTQRNPWGDDNFRTTSVIRRRATRTETPGGSEDEREAILDIDHLSRLLEGPDQDSRNEAHILASHLRASKDGRIMTRARYKKELELTKARVLTSSRIQLAQLQSSTSTAPYSVAASAASSAVHLPSTATPAPFHHPTDPPFNSAYLFQQQQQPPHRPSLEQESEILERLIILRRLNQPLNPLSQEMSSTFGEQGPQCVVCHAAPRSVISWPCRCLTLCEDCRVQCAMNNVSRCVTCRREVTGFARLWVP